MANGLFNLKQVVQAVQQGGWSAQKPPTVEYLVVAGGGGGGGSYEGAGAGAGGLLQGLDPVPNGQTLLVTVGAGGTGGTAHSTTVTNTNGSNSVFGSIAAVGGGKAGSAEPATPLTVLNGSAGGSGGGGTRWGIYGYGQPGMGLFGQGNQGGRSNANSGAAGGGGGAGSIGLNAFADTLGGNGGSGVASAISGTITAYAGGGGGSSGSIGGTGGAGGGGANDTAGTANTGGGGGGSRSSGNGGNGGSGIVFVSYPDTYAAASATTGSPTVSTSGSGSILFNGANQYLSIANNAALQFGTGNFTVEGWYYLTTATNTNNSLFSIGSYNGGILLRYAVSSTDNLYVNNTSYNWNPVTNFLLNQWNHVAVVRNGTVLSIYVNGTSIFAVTNTADIVQSTATSVGTATHDLLSEEWTGNISNFRIVKGSAVYTSNFTPPTIPLTAITNTSYLLNAVSGAYTADSSSNSFSPSSSIDVAPKWSALSPFTVTGYKNRVYRWTSSGSITF